MRYAFVAAALVASVAAVPLERRQWPGWDGQLPDYDGDCEVSWVIVDPQSATSSSAVIIDPIPTTSSAIIDEPAPTTSSAVVEPVETTSAEPTTTRRPHWGHGPHTGTGKPTGYPQTTKKTSKPEPEPTPSSSNPPVIPSSTAAPPSSSPPETTQQPTSAGDLPFPYPSPSPTQTLWDAEPVNSAAHSTSYADPATATTEPQCTAAAAAYVSAAIDGHNAKRAQHAANPLVWDDNLSCIAQRQAASCIWDHLTYVNGGGYGQNLAGGSGTTIDDSIEMWYGEAPEYDGYYGEANPPFVAGHFTQMVWASTTSLGCATHTCDGSTGDFTGDLTVCNYYEFGNMAGAYAENVLPGTGTSSGSGSSSSSSGGW